MRKKDIEKIMQQHLHLEEDDTFDYRDIPSPDFIDDLRAQLPQQTRRKRRVPAWAGAVAGATAMFLFMLTPVGQAIPEKLYSISIQNNDTNKNTDVIYTGKINEDIVSQQNGNVIKNNSTYNDIESFKYAYPNLAHIQNTEYVPQKIQVEFWDYFIQISYSYPNNLYISQITYLADTGKSNSFTLHGKNPQIDTTFNNSSIAVIGSYAGSTGLAVAYDQNCEYTFRCTDVPLEEFVEFIEGCYLE